MCKSLMKLIHVGEPVKARFVGAPGPRDYFATRIGDVLSREGRDYDSVNAFSSAMAILHWNDDKPHTPHGATVCSVMRGGMWVTLKVLETRLAVAVAVAAPAPPVAAPAANPKPKKESRRALRRRLAASEDRCAATLMLLEEAEARLATLERIHSQIGSLVAPEVEILSD